MHGHANGGTCRRETIAGLYTRSMRALEGMDGHIEMTRGVRDASEKRQVGSAQRRARVRFHQELVCDAPLALSGGSTRTF
jgi:hypothetical protein